MKLTELNPRWVGLPGPIYDGVAFDCPHCKVQRLAITFSPPIDPNGWWPKITQPTYAGQNVWKRGSGDTFETLTISPSVDASNQVEFKNHWHGFITQGEVT
jgi:hypothetical protein